MLFHELLITDLSSSVVVVVMATFLTFVVTTCHVTLFVEVAIHQQRRIQTLFNGRTQSRDSFKWYEEVGHVKQIHKHLVAITSETIGCFKT